MSISAQFLRKVSQSMSGVGQTLGAVLLPQDCFLCGALAGRSLLCNACTTDLPRLPASLCTICALPTPGDAVCGNCLKKAPYFDATQACFRYAFPVDRLVQSLKYNHRLAVAAFLGDAMLAAASQVAPADMILAVPLAPRRMQERGFNQALEIARPLARKLHLPLVISGYSHTLNNASQASLPWKERQKNIRGAFECALDLEGKSLIVIDDVMTTGATLNEFARILKNHGAARVSNWVVARALKE